MAGLSNGVKKIYMNSVLLEEVENENHLVITEIGTVVSLYEKVEKRQCPLIS